VSNSWGHTLQRISDERRAELAHEPGCTCGCRRYKSCTAGRRDHLQPAAYWFTYSYVTGRAGRVSYASKLLCTDHAAKAAEKYGIDLAEAAEGERPRHASEEAVEQLFGSRP
jgi:hypothetical protein